MIYTKQFERMDIMDWSKVVDLIKPELLILVAFVWVLGLFFKKAPWFEAEWKIPFILLAVSILFAILYVAFVLGEGLIIAVIISSIIQGTLIAALAVFGNEMVKQITIKRVEYNEATKWQKN